MSQTEQARSLRKVMEREVGILRELLGSLQQEQQAVLTNRAAEVKHLIQQRERIVYSMTEAREQRIQLLRELSGKSSELTQEEALAAFESIEGEERLQLLSLRDQLLALLDQLAQQTKQNNALLDGKVNLTKELLGQLCPSQPNPTYGAQGEVKPKVQTATITLINREV